MDEEFYDVYDPTQTSLLVNQECPVIRVSIKNEWFYPCLHFSSFSKQLDNIFVYIL